MIAVIDLTALQKRVYQNKVNKGFNVTDVYKELCYAQGELTEVFEAYIKKKDDLGEEIADVAMYLLGLAEILGYDLETELLKKMEINEKRQYIQRDGVTIRVSDEG
jgi:NTP pyrophosphatase (non-canonical NTP hydrolase)